MVRGYEYEKDRYVVLDPEDFEKAEGEASRNINVVAFVESSSLQVPYLNKTYYLIPTEGAEKGYLLLSKALSARGKSPAGRVASAVGPDARRADRGDAVSSSRRQNTTDGPTPPQPKGLQGFAAAGRRYSSSTMSRNRLLLAPCQRPQIPGARAHATFTTGCYRTPDEWGSRGLS